jgi:hypothetical protein
MEAADDSEQEEKKAAKKVGKKELPAEGEKVIDLGNESWSKQLEGMDDEEKKAAEAIKKMLSKKTDEK